MKNKHEMDAVSTGNTPEYRRNLRFLILSSDKFPPTRVDVSVLFGQEMVNRGHTIDWILQSESASESSYRTEWKSCRVWVGATDLGSSRIKRFRKHFLSFVHDFVMFKCVIQNKYDFIQVKDKFLIAPFAAFLAKLIGCRFTFWLSYPFPEASLYRARDGSARYPVLYLIRGRVLKMMLYRIILPIADHIFVQSEQMKKDLIMERIPAEKITPVPMGVMLDSFPSSKSTDISDSNNGEHRVVYLGTLLKVRKIDFLVRVFSYVIKRVPDAHLYLVGGGDDPSDEKILWNEADRLGVKEKMTITGMLPQAEAWSYVAKADVCASPFYPTPILNSTSPTKLIEYMAMGKAVVANDHPEQRLVLSESRGGYCVPYVESVFADAIVKLLLDPVKANEMGVSGKEYVETHRNYRVIGNNLEMKYYSLL